ncbi:ATP cone domain-containing protein [candidate division KSB1 bacterium]
MTEEILIKKTDGSIEPFDVSKLKRSLKRAGVSEEVIRGIVEKVSSELTEGMTTSQIYKKAYSFLRKKEGRCLVVARYSLKRAVFALGPSGFPFETFVGEIYRTQGYRVSNGDIVHGKCIEHEVDLLATSEGKTLAAEIKFHNRLGIKTDVKVALYVHARFEDLVGHRDPESGVLIDEPMLITNTKFTSNAIKYGECVGMKMISWDYPREKGNLHGLITEAGLHPITSLPSLSSSERKLLLENNIVLCRDVKDKSSSLERLGISPKKIPLLIKDASTLCKPCNEV